MRRKYYIKYFILCFFLLLSCNLNAQTSRIIKEIAEEILKKVSANKNVSYIVFKNSVKGSPKYIKYIGNNKFSDESLELIYHYRKKNLTHLEIEDIIKNPKRMSFKLRNFIKNGNSTVTDRQFYKRYIRRHRKNESKKLAGANNKVSPIKSQNTIQTVRLNTESNVHVRIEGYNMQKEKYLAEQLNWEYGLDEIVILPLTTNRATKTYLTKHLYKSSIPQKPNSIEDVSLLLKPHQRKTIFVVGHVENNHYVMGNIKISISELNRTARLHNQNIFHLGCNTAKMSKAGTIGKINTLKTVKALDESMSGTSNFRDLLYNLSKQKIGPGDTNVDFLIDVDVFKNRGFLVYQIMHQAATDALIIGAGAGAYKISPKDSKQ